MGDDEPTYGWGVNDSIPLYGSGEPFHGHISHVMMFDRALTNAEIERLLNPGKMPVPKWYERAWMWLKNKYRRMFRRKRSLEEVILSMHPIFYASPYKGHSVGKYTMHWYANGEWHEHEVNNGNN